MLGELLIIGECRTRLLLTGLEMISAKIGSKFKDCLSPNESGSELLPVDVKLEAAGRVFGFFLFGDAGAFISYIWRKTISSEVSTRLVVVLFSSCWISFRLMLIGPGLDIILLNSSKRTVCLGGGIKYSVLEVTLASESFPDTSTDSFWWRGCVIVFGIDSLEGGIDESSSDSTEVFCENWTFSFVSRRISGTDKVRGLFCWFVWISVRQSRQLSRGYKK